MSRREFDALTAGEEELLTRVEGVRIRDAAMMLYTSGTTSQPRGAIISHEAYVRGWVSTAKVWGTGPEDRQFTALPLYHVTALGCMTWVLYAGGTFISDYSWDAGRALRLLETEQVTEFYPAYQPVMEDLLSHPDFAHDRPQPHPPVPQRRPARGAGQVPEPPPARDPDDRLRRHRGRPGLAHPPRRPARGAPEHLRLRARGDRDARRRRAAGNEVAARHARRDPVPRLEHAHRVPQVTGQERRSRCCPAGG